MTHNLSLALMLTAEGHCMQFLGADFSYTTALSSLRSTAGSASRQHGAGWVEI